jgi:hypothetical protein
MSGESGVGRGSGSSTVELTVGLAIAGRHWFAQQAGERRNKLRHHRFYRVIARLSPSRSLNEAEAEPNSIATALEQAFRPFRDRPSSACYSRLRACAPSSG